MSKREKFFEEIHFLCPHKKLISTIIKENAEEVGKRFCGIVQHQTLKKGIFCRKLFDFPRKSVPQTYPKCLKG